LLLGMKGTMSEMELSLFRQRSREAMRQKAQRGELFLTLAIGYVKAGDNRIEKIADRRVQKALELVFNKFGELQSIRQVLVWLRQEQIRLPVVSGGRSELAIEWRLPVYSTVWHMLKNPVYAGAYAFGRRSVRVTIENGRKRVSRSIQPSWQDWDVLIRDHHDGYISWADYERNQRLIADNANGKRFLSRGAIRRGEALLPGLLRCARCGRKLHVRYSGAGGNTQRYACTGPFSKMAADACIKFGGMRLDRRVSAEVIERLQPLGVEAAIAASENLSLQQAEKRQQLEFALQQARYEAARAHRQYDAADPENRLVTGELERRWNERLQIVMGHEAELAAMEASDKPPLSDDDRARLMNLGVDLARTWDLPGTTPETRKKIIRILISEIIIDVADDNLELVIHWQGGDHTSLTMRKNRVGRTRWHTDADTIDLIRHLARLMPDEAIAAVLNRSGKMTGRGASWTRVKICSVRAQQNIAVYREGERAERGEITLDEAAAQLLISPSTVRRMIGSGAIAGRQLCKGAPWIIQQDDIADEKVVREADARRARRAVPAQSQQILELL
jgi:hypothetical protein